MTSHANRGMALEHYINLANAQYHALEVAEVQKIPVAVHVSQDRRRENQVNINRERSTVDYTGVWDGWHLAFDAKENQDPAGFPLKNVKDHQVDHLRRTQRQRGLSFLLILHEPDQTVYLLPYHQLAEYWAAWKKGGPASIPADQLRRLPKVKAGRGVALDYLATLDAWLKSENGGLAHAPKTAAGRL